MSAMLVPSLRARPDIQCYWISITLAFNVTHFFLGGQGLHPDQGCSFLPMGVYFLEATANVWLRACVRKRHQFPMCLPKPTASLLAHRGTDSECTSGAQVYPKGSFLPKKGSRATASMWSQQAGSGDSQGKHHPTSSWGEMDIVGFRRVWFSPLFPK